MISPRGCWSGQLVAPPCPGREFTPARWATGEQSSRGDRKRSETLLGRCSCPGPGAHRRPMTSLLSEMRQPSVAVASDPIPPTGLPSPFTQGHLLLSGSWASPYAAIFWQPRQPLGPLPVLPMPRLGSVLALGPYSAPRHTTRWPTSGPAVPIWAFQVALDPRSVSKVP